METSKAALERRLLFGALFWGIFSFVAVALRGVRWEETYEHALLITGVVPFPEGHPSFIYARNVFSLQSYLSALLLTLTDSPVLVNGLRNVIHLCFSTIPVFMLGSLLAGKARWGHLAAVMILVGIHQDFQSYYPLVPWPNMYGIGQIGMGLAMLGLAFLLGGYFRAAALLMGLMVSLHIGQLPVLLAVAGFFFILGWRSGRQEICRATAPWFAAGLAISLGFLVIQRVLFHVPLASEPPYAGEGDVHSIWIGYSSLYDIHRFFPRFNPFAHSLILMFAALGFGLESAWEERRNRPNAHSARLLLLYIVLACATVWICMGLHRILGDSVPFLLVGWMPYRLTNHLAPIVLVLIFAIIARAEGEHRRWRGLWIPVVLACLLGALIPFLKDRMRDDGYESFIENPVPIFYLLAGAAAMAAAGRSSGGRWLHGLAVVLGLTLWIALDRRLGTSPAMAWSIQAAICLVVPAFLGVITRTGVIASTLTGVAVGIPFLALSSYHQFGTAFAAIGAVFTAIGYGVFSLKAPGRPLPALVMVGLMALPIAALLDREYRFREHLPVSDFERQVTEYLESKGEQDAMLVPPYWDIEWLSRTRHPVMSDYQTAHHMTYVPALAPSIKHMHEAVFGDPIDRSDDDGQLNVWRERTLEEWQAIGKEFGFRYVIAPEWVGPALPLVLQVEQEGLYEIPMTAPE